MNSLLTRLENDLRVLDKCDQVRTLVPPKGSDFCSNDYLALSKHPRIINAVKTTVEQDGYGSSSSRYIRGDRNSYHSLQTRLAQFKRCDKAELFSSGYAANVGALSSLIKKGDVVFSDQLNHASIIDGLRLSGANINIFPHASVEKLYQGLKRAPSNAQKFLVTESLFSMDGDIAPLHKYAEIASEFDVAMIVDEAHAVGLYGENGSGLIDHFQVNSAVTLSINGLGKAFGCYGAFVGGHHLAVNYITQRARTLMYTTALPPLAISAIDAALDIIEAGDDLRKQLFHNVLIFSHELKSANIGCFDHVISPIIPIIIGDNRRAKSVADKMQEAGFDVRAIRPPTVPDQSARLRITINISHNADLIRTFVEHLRISL